MVQSKLARDVMVTKLVTLPPETLVYDGITRLVRENISGAPVVDRQNNFLGVFSEKCCMKVLALLARYAKDQGKEVSIQAKDFMVSELMTLTPEMDVFDAIGHLIRHRISGAPVLDTNGELLGVFSEKTSMHVLISAAYDQLPTTHVDAFMNKDMNRVIAADTEFLNVAKIFVDTPYRRLEVVRDGKLLGQISRRDVLRAGQKVPLPAELRDEALADSLPSDQPATGGELSEPSNPATRISSFMDREPKTITEDIDFLNIARVFLDTPYRRLPVVNDGKLVGQVSRRDLLRVANELMNIDPPPKKKTFLYLSSLIKHEDAPFD